MSALIVVIALVGGLIIYANLDAITKYVAQTLVDASKLDIESITISKCDETGFTISLTAKIFDTGPLDATIADMTLSMFSTKTGKAFAKVSLPPINASPSGAICVVVDQRVEILDFEAFDTFNKNLLLQEELPVYLQGSGNLTLAWPVHLSTVVSYEKVAVLPGLDGVHIAVVRTRKATRSLFKGNPTAIEVDVIITSASPVSIHMGVVAVDILFRGMRVAKMEADLFLKPGENHVVFVGTKDIASISANLSTGLRFLKQDLMEKNGVVAFVKGSKGKQCAWLDRVVKTMNSRIVMSSTMASILKSMRETETIVNDVAEVATAA